MVKDIIIALISSELTGKLQKIIEAKKFSQLLSIIKDKVMIVLQEHEAEPYYNSLDKFFSQHHIVEKIINYYFKINNTGNYQGIIDNLKLGNMGLSSYEISKIESLIDKISKIIDSELNGAVSDDQRRLFNHITKTSINIVSDLSSKINDMERQFTESRAEVYPITLINQKIDDEVTILRKSRFFRGFNKTDYARTLAKQLVEGQFTHGSIEVKRRALAWCVRIISSEDVRESDELYNVLRTMGNSQEIELAQAFIFSNKGDVKSALASISHLNNNQSRSAALMIVAKSMKIDKTFEWLDTVNFSFQDLDSDGKFILLKLQLERSYWDAALNNVAHITIDDKAETPILFHMVGLIYLLNTVPEEYRSTVSNSIPFNASDFPLSSTEAAMEKRKYASCQFKEAVRAAQELHCTSVATMDEDYALWLDLRDPDETDKARLLLETRLKDTKSALRLINFALQFNVKIDSDMVDREIERTIALNGSITYEAAVARYSLLYTKNSPEEAAKYLSLHIEEISNYFDKKSLQIQLVDLLVHAGKVEQAKKGLEELREQGLSAHDEARLQRVILEAEGTNQIAPLKNSYKRSGSLIDLELLVRTLYIAHEWDEICNYGRDLYKITQDIRHAELLINALNNAHQYEQIVDIVEINQSLLKNLNIKLLYCWALFFAGHLIEAHKLSASIDLSNDDPNCRALHVNLMIALGDWNSLSSVISFEYAHKELREAGALLSAARLALNIGSPYAKELALAAVEKGKADASILASAYFLAANAGWEEDPEVASWLQKAVQLSGEEGPMRQMSLESVKESLSKSNWFEHEAEVWKQLYSGEIPMYVAAQLLNKSLIQMMLYPAITNQVETDPRRRGVILAYSCNKHIQPLNCNNVISLDVTSILTLSFLKILDKVIDSFKTIILPHNTLKWFFDEKHNVVFHQPSKFKHAARIQHLYTVGVLERLEASVLPSSELTAQIGEELALLIAEAENGNKCGKGKHIVIHSYPIYYTASFLEAKVDMEEHEAVLSSYQSIIDKLVEMGKLTAEEERKSRLYLQMHDRAWPNQMVIDDKSTLYLDTLAIHYFLQIGILEKIKLAGFRIITSDKEFQEVGDYIKYQSISCDLLDLIEDIRRIINKGIYSCKVKVGKMNFCDTVDDRSLSEFPTSDLFALAHKCDCAVIDDRFISKLGFISDEGRKIPIYTTLDVLDILTTAAIITPDAKKECLTQLRRAGYCLMPLCDNELDVYLCASPVKNDVIHEKAELKAIRENILLVRMRSILQMPTEYAWLNMIQKSLVGALHKIWTSSIDLSCIHAYSDWIIRQMDTNGWAHNFKDRADFIVKDGRGLYILYILAQPPELSSEKQVEYWNWFEHRVLAPIKEQEPGLFAWITDFYRSRVRNLADDI